MRRTLGIGVAAAASLGLLAGCGSGSGSSSSKSSSSAATPASAPTDGTTATTSAAASPGVTVQTKHAGKLGTILAAGPKQLTVYLFEGDTGSKSTCEGECAKAWPPVTTGGAPLAAGGAVSADLGTITRPDGAKQVTYKGHPLYFFVQDGDAGDAYGEGSTAFGAGWYALRANGGKVDES